MPEKLLYLTLSALLGSVSLARADTDMQMQEKALKAREQSQGSTRDHAAHAPDQAEAGRFRGVFYGYLPCAEANCDGLKMTLSLNAKNNYLLVMQPAKPQNRESFEKGKYAWNDGTATLTLTPNRPVVPPRRLAIQDEGTLLYLPEDGNPAPGNRDRYLLRRSDRAENRELHIH